MNKRQRKREDKKTELLCSHGVSSYRELRAVLRDYRGYVIDIERAKKKCRGCEYFKHDVCTRDFFKPCVRGE